MSPAPPSAIILMAPHSPRYKAPLTCKLHSFRSVDLDIVTSFFLLDTGLDKPTRNRDPALDPFPPGWMEIETARAVSDTFRPYPEHVPREQGHYAGRPAVAAVSYTHLRAHETRHDLVCRLLLEKK